MRLEYIHHRSIETSVLVLQNPNVEYRRPAKLTSFWREPIWQRDETCFFVVSSKSVSSGRLPMHCHPSSATTVGLSWIASSSSFRKTRFRGHTASPIGCEKILISNTKLVAIGSFENWKVNARERRRNILSPVGLHSRGIEWHDTGIIARHEAQTH